MALQTSDGAPLAPRSLSRPWVPDVALPAMAALGVALVWALGWAGSDIPAQVYRVGLFRAHGWIPFDLGWYSGQAVLSYSALFPALASKFGLYGASALSAAAATWSFHELVRRRCSAARLGTVLFALGTFVSVTIGQLPFLAGEALGLSCLVAAQRGRRLLTVLLAAACGLTSPVAVAFLALAAVAWGIGSREERAVAVRITVAAVLPVVVVNLGSSPGPMPFPGQQLVVILVISALGLAIVGRREPVLTLGIALYAGAAVILITFPNPMGGNMGRLCTAFGPALAAMYGAGRGRAVAIAAAAPLLLWQWSPVAGVAASAGNSSNQASYFAPLLGFLARQPAVGRLEIPFTQDHWETAYVAGHVPLARGWERQLDIADNPIFYGSGTLDAMTYHQWLDDTGVSWVALPDVALDYSSQQEARLIDGGLDFLQPIFRSTHWRVWEVVDSPGIVSGPSRLVSMTSAGFVLDAQPGSALVRVRYTSDWTVKSGSACIDGAPGGWTDVVVTTPGLVTVGTTLLPHFSRDC